MDNKRTVSYLTFASFPSRAAHAVHIMNMCRALAENGYRVTLYGHIKGESDLIYSHYGIETPFLLKSVHVGKARFLGRLAALVRMTAFIRRDTSDLLYTRDLFNGWAAARSGRPFFFELHELPDGFFRRRLLFSILNSAGLKRLIFISNRLKTLFEERFGLPPVSICVAHDGVNLKDFLPERSKVDLRKAVNLPRDAFIAGYTGSLFPGRGSEIVLQLAERLPGMVFVLVGGEGRYLEDWRKRILSSGLSNIILSGYVPYSSVPSYLHAFDALLMPYQKKVLHRQAGHDTVEYMSPLKMFEYMAAGRPLISSRLPVLEEVLKDGDNALLVDPDDIGMWSDALLRVKADEDLAQKLSRQAGKDAEEYTWSKRVRLIFDEGRED
ncbi:MAG: glycosyltransferase family 4 protein [Acidobacteriota bacterium]